VLQCPPSAGKAELILGKGAEMCLCQRSRRRCFAFRFPGIGPDPGQRIQSQTQKPMTAMPRNESAHFC